MSAGTVSAGAVVSTTVTWNEACPVLPAASVALHVTSVEPRPNVLPEAGTHVVGRLPLTMSNADAENVALAPDGPVASFVMSLGTVTAGGVVSTTFTLNFAEPVLPAASVALHVTSVEPRPNVLPEAGTHVVGRLPLTMSNADAENVAVAPAGLVASVVMSAGTVTAGGVVSRTTTLKLPSAVLPELSVAVQSTVVVPSANVLPEGGSQTASTLGSTVSLAVAM